MEKKWITTVVTLTMLLALVLGVGPAPLRGTVAPAFADSDDDHYNALVIGMPDKDVDTVYDAGAFHVLYSSALGPSIGNLQLWHQNASGVLGAAEEEDRFGFAFAVGDFNGDGYSDLAVGVPGESIGDTAKAGLVQVFYAGADGLSSANNEMWNQGTSGIQGAVEAYDQFGYALAAGDFDGDGYDDLAIGVPFEDKGDEVNTGAVNIIYGSANGLTAEDDQIWDQDDFPASSAEPGDLFGYSLAVGDFDGDGYDDLAIGAPYEDWGSTGNAGAVNVLYGTSSGLSSADGQIWSQANSSIDDTDEESDSFGYALAAGDFNGDGRDDLAIGVPGEDVAGITNCGAVNVLYGYSAGGLLPSGSQFWYQDSTYIPDGPENDDSFGETLAAGDFDGDGYDDLAVGVPTEDVDVSGSTVNNAGAVNVLYGSSAKLQAEASQFWYQSNLMDMSEEGDRFGNSLAAGDFDGDGYDDLAIGSPYEDEAAVTDAGKVSIIFGFGGGLGGRITLISPSPAEDYDHYGDSLAVLPTVKHKVHLPITLKGHSG